jgi:hypothetical protein
MNSNLKEWLQVGFAGLLVGAIWVGYDAYKGRNSASQENAPKVEKIRNTGFCGYGEADTSEKYKCKTPSGLTFQLQDRPEDVFTYAGGGIYHVSFYVSNANTAPIQVRETINQIMTSDGNIYEPIQSNDPFNPGGICEGTVYSWGPRLNPGDGGTVVACYALDSGTEVVQLRGIDNSGSPVFAININSVVGKP